MLRQMLPHLALHDAIDSPKANWVVKSDRALRLSGSVARSNSPHILSGQTRHAVALPSRPAFGVQRASVLSTALDALRGATAPVLIALLDAPLVRGVLHVLGIRAQEQVIGPDALRIIAGVADVPVVGKMTVRDEIGDAVSKVQAGIDADLSVSAPVLLCCPQPTIAGLIDLRPEARELDRGKMGEHSEPPFRGVIPPAVDAARGLSYALNYTTLLSIYAPQRSTP